MTTNLPHKIVEAQVAFLYEVRGGSLPGFTGNESELQYLINDKVHEKAYRGIEAEYKTLAGAVRTVEDREVNFECPAYELCEDSPSIDFKDKLAAGVWFAMDDMAFTRGQVLELEHLCTKAFTRAAGGIGATAHLLAVRKYTTFKYSATEDIEVLPGKPLADCNLG